MFVQLKMETMEMDCEEQSISLETLESRGKELVDDQQDTNNLRSSLSTIHESVIQIDMGTTSTTNDDSDVFREFRDIFSSYK